MESSLVCRVRGGRCAFPIADVEETMRPLPIVPVAGAPAFVRGLAIIRGVPTPVVDASVLLTGDAATTTTRFVTLRAGQRRVALLVDAVETVTTLSRQSVEALPPLLQQAQVEAVAGVGVLDADFLFVLRSARLVPDDVWASMQAAGASA